MHLDIGLPLLSELDQLRKTFWQNRNYQNLINTEDKSPDSCEESGCSQPQRQSAETRSPPESANNNQNRTQSRLERLNSQHSQDAITEHGLLSGECTENSPDKCRSCCSSAGTQSGQNGSEPYENNNPSGQPQSQREASESLLEESNSLRRICGVLWDKSTEDSSLL